MTIKTLSTKGQLVIPLEIREAHGWTPGTALEILDQGDRVVVREADLLPETTLDDLIGCAGYTGPRRSLADFEAAIAEGARRRR